MLTIHSSSFFIANFPPALLRSKIYAADPSTAQAKRKQKQARNRQAPCIVSWCLRRLPGPQAEGGGRIDMNERTNRKAKLLGKDFIQPEHSAGTTASYPALQLVQNEQRFYFTTIPASDIFPYCFVLRRDESGVEGFQRALDSGRARDIASYLDNSVGSIPTNIVLSAQESACLQYLPRTKTIKYSRRPSGFLVLDGQHRLFGYGLTKKKHRVPVAIYEGLSRREEAALFIDINTNQRGVPAALLLDIKQVAERETQTEANLRSLFNRLNEDKDSALRGLLSAAKSVAGKISRVTFNRAVKDILDDSVMIKLSEGKQYELLRGFLNAVERTLKNKSLLTKSSYFEAFCGIFTEVLRLSLTKHREFKPSSLEDVLSGIANIDLEAVLARGRTKISKATVLPILKQALGGQLEIREDMV
jgi:DNA sulfur modification protein DndB